LTCKKCRDEFRKEWYNNNKEHVLEYAAKYRKTYYITNKESISKRTKIYKANNKEKLRNDSRKRRNLKRNVACEYSETEWMQCCKYFNNKCAYCGKEEKLTQDHFIALNKGGEYTKNNIVPACLSCNSSKCHRDFFVWYPKQPFYSKKREQKILKYLNYDPKTKYQQIAL
jgi:hypothetical protein